ncbi:MAG: hypothetical protein H0V76_10820 [Blastocatellia bacterium]|nr:hypothetical protein [Blastocatellia bacterium]
MQAVLQFQYLPRTYSSAGLSVFRLLLFVIISAAASISVFSQISTSPDGQTLTIDDAPEMRVIAFSKTVIIKKHVQEVFVWGGDVVIEGRVEGDVAVIGGTVTQAADAYIGGAVIVFGGVYKFEAAEPLRGEGKETIMIGAFEDELRTLAQNPSQMLAPQWTLAFAAQRILSVLFWFVVTLGVATIAPGAVSRAIARFHLSPAKVIGLGLAGLILTTVVVSAGLGLLPDYVSALLGLMAFALIMLAYVFGRVALQVSTGKLLQKRLTKGRSEAVAILLGVVTWTVLLSVPYFWTLALLALFSAGIGLVLTLRPSDRWRST